MEVQVFSNALQQVPFLHRAICIGNWGAASTATAAVGPGPSGEGSGGGRREGGGGGGGGRGGGIHWVETEIGTKNCKNKSSV